MEPIEKKFLADPETSGLNADDADFSVGLNQILNSENVRWGSTDKGVINTVESIGGTLLLSEVQPSVTFIYIGSATDTPNNRFFYFLYNQYTPDHKIMCYSADDNTVYTVLLSTQVTGGLNFNKNYPIHSARVVGNLLYWTDNYTEPKRINVEAAIKLNNPSYVTDEEAYTSPLAQSVITLIRRPPGVPPTIGLNTDVTRENFIKQFAGQFAIRYIYRDGEYSAIGIPSGMINYRLELLGFTGLDNFNYLSVQLNSNSGLAPELIEQDVQIVQFLVRYDNSPQYFVIKEWNKDNPTEAAEIAAYNAGGPGSELDYNFYNDKVGIPVDNATSVKPSDSVPNLSETLEVALGRLFLANNTKGYDTPTVTSLTGTPNSVSAALGDEIFKSNSTYQIGIRFRDNYKRACGVVTSPDLVIEIPDRGDYNDPTGFSTFIQWTLSNTNAINEIPDWAYYYDLLITKNLRTRFFVQWVPNSIKYVIKNLDGTFTYQNTFSGNVYGFAIGTASLSYQGMGVIYTPGDQVRLYFDGLSPAPITLAVIAQDADYIILSPRDFGDTTPISFLFTEYYVPYFQQSNEPFYTNGTSYAISAPGTSGRQYTTLSGNFGADCQFVPRQTILLTTYYTEAMSPNDNVWQNWLFIYGETNIVTLLGQEQKKNAVQWSNTVIPGTQTNGLSTFDALDEKLLPISMGAIMKLQQTSKVQEQGNVMLAIGQDETASLYLGEVQVVGASANAFLAQAENVIGTVNILKGNFGTVNPESVTEYRGNVYWLDATNGRVIQYSSNGLYPISNYKMTRFWKLFCDQYLSMTSTEIEALGSRPYVFMTVDPYHDELLISIPKLLDTPPKGYLPDYPSIIYPFDIWDGQAKTIVFDIKSQPNHWQGAYKITAEGFVTIQNKLYSFKNGQAYLHNQTNNYNEIYGVQYNSKVMVVSNQEPNIPKVYNNLSVEGNMKPNFVYFYNDFPYQQSSDLVDTDFRDLEGVQYATVYRNKLIPTATGFLSTGLLTGEKMRGVTMKIMLEFNVTTTPLELKFLNIGYSKSLGHKTV